MERNTRNNAAGYGMVWYAKNFAAALAVAVAALGLAEEEEGRGGGGEGEGQGEGGGGEEGGEPRSLRRCARLSIIKYRRDIHLIGRLVRRRRKGRLNIPTPRNCGEPNSDSDHYC